MPLGDDVVDKNNPSKRAAREAFLKRPANQIITLIQSQFPGRDPYLFFPYPPFLKI
jgi:hypothetical protein